MSILPSRVRTLKYYVNIYYRNDEMYRGLILSIIHFPV